MSSSPSRPGFLHWLRGLRTGSNGQHRASKPADPLRSAGQLLREARESKGMRLRDLAEHTRISIAVLEALEGGWKDRLPEVTYLRAMAPLLEQHLELPKGSLDSLLAHAGPKSRTAQMRGGPAAPLSPSALALLNSWQSTLAYGLLVLGLLYGVNLQQQRLAATGQLVARPIPLLPPPSERRGEPPDVSADLRPLAQAARGQALELLARDSKRGGPDLTLGVLQLNLSAPTAVDLRSSRGGQTQLQDVKGDLSLPVLPPFELRLEPAPPAAAVRWRGQVLKGKAPQPGTTATTDPKPPGIYAVPLSR